MTIAEKRDLQRIKKALQLILRDLDAIVEIDQRDGNPDIAWRRVFNQIGIAYRAFDRTEKRLSERSALVTRVFEGQYRTGPGKMDAYLPGGPKFTGALFGEVE